MEDKSLNTFLLSLGYSHQYHLTAINHMNAFEHCHLTDTDTVLNTDEQTCACPTSTELWVELVMLVDRVNWNSVFFLFQWVTDWLGFYKSKLFMTEHMEKSSSLLVIYGMSTLTVCSLWLIAEYILLLLGMTIANFSSNAR